VPVEVLEQQQRQQQQQVTSQQQWAPASAAGANSGRQISWQHSRKTTAALFVKLTAVVHRQIYPAENQASDYKVLAFKEVGKRYTWYLLLLQLQQQQQLQWRRQQHGSSVCQ
jgi:hypothetical protein